MDPTINIFTLTQIREATKNFDPSNKLGEGGFGSVFKGTLSDGTIIAVKQLSPKSNQGYREFVNEIAIIYKLSHPNLVRLYGCCAHGNQLCLVYEYMENNSLSHVLLENSNVMTNLVGSDKVSKAKLTWPIRFKICIGIAQGLGYLHGKNVIHRDIKPSNVLLDDDMTPKISDFGLAKLNDDGNTHISTRGMGTFGYLAPEYATRRYLTPKVDVYSFGIMVFGIVTGEKNNHVKRAPEPDWHLVDWVYVTKEKGGNLLDLVDPDLGSEYSSEEALMLLHVAFLCIMSAPHMRPSIFQVIEMLEGQVNHTQFSQPKGPCPNIQHLHFHPDETSPRSNELHNESFVTESFVTESFMTESFVTESFIKEST
ncbi:putative protein kinase RLK-Pelle-DLSV family [Helianthus anomalus]